MRWGAGQYAAERIRSLILPATPGRSGKALDEKDISDFRSYCEENGVEQIVAHAPYTLNPCAEKENVRVFAKMVLTEDLGRMEYTPGQFYNFHPGSHVGRHEKRN